MTPRVNHRVGIAVGFDLFVINGSDFIMVTASSSYSEFAEESLGHGVSSSLSSSSMEIRELVTCDTCVGVSNFANKFLDVFSATWLTPSDVVNARSINNSNVLIVSNKYTSPEAAIEILDTWLNTSFKSVCPANGNKPWPEEIQNFIDHF
ncbi:Sugar-phosphate isomerase, RpiB/LacA/LacB family [Sesbania bispinosa]|nr:Sugar-phosphate isomerase, RpiB/LacA/LacB family [Sesbania bispinosa]